MKNSHEDTKAQRKNDNIKKLRAFVAIKKLNL